MRRRQTGDKHIGRTRFSPGVIKDLLNGTPSMREDVATTRVLSDTSTRYPGDDINRINLLGPGRTNQANNLRPDPARVRALFRSRG
jgi:hypothetical protein